MLRNFTLMLTVMMMIAMGTACQKEKAPEVPIEKPQPEKPKGISLGEQMFQDIWQHVSPHSAIISWSCGDRENGARSQIEYGLTEEYGQLTEMSDSLRLNQFHRLNGLEPGQTYNCRLVSLDKESVKTYSENFVIKPVLSEEAIALEGGTLEEQLIISNPGYYVLMNDIIASGSGIGIEASDVTLDLNGHTLTYATKSTKRCYGVLINTRKSNNKNVKAVNGVIIQKAPEGEYTEKYGSYGAGSFSKGENFELAGLSITVSQKCARPISIAHPVKDYAIHHNYCVSYVNTLVSRHWPGNAMAAANTGSGKNWIHNNILLNGPHRGIRMSGNKEGEADARIFANDVSIEQGYVNGYAINCCHNLKVYGNRVNSMSRGIHITTTNVEVFENYFDLTQHQVYDDRPQGKTNWRHYYTVIHGIKLENCGTGVKVHHNKVIGTQLLPDPDAKQRFTGAVKGTFEFMNKEKKGDRDLWAAPTPLNFSAKPNAMTEVYENEFIGITNYKKARARFDYGAQGEWATGIYVAGDSGPSEEGKYAVWIHDNIFKSNDSFIMGSKYQQTLKVENNKFILLANPIEGHAPYRGTEQFKELLENNNNIIETAKP